jgi:hypothetical protein
VKYDDASWHYAGDFLEGLPHDAAPTHTGMSVAWALLTGSPGQFAWMTFPITFEG